MIQNTLRSAVELHQAGHLARAAALYERVLELDPENAEAMHLLGVVHHQQGDQQKAIALVSRSVALRPNAPGYHANLAEVYRTIGEYEKAVGSCRTALALRPNYPEALCNLGLSLSRIGRAEEAIGHLKRAIELDPSMPAAQNNLGNVLRGLGRVEEGLAHVRKAVELDPNYAPARTNLGQMLLDLKRPAEALPHCEEAARREPASAVMRHNLGNALRDLERYVDARSAYLEAIQLDPRLAMSHAQIGVTLVREGQYAEALPWLRKAAELAPDNDFILEKLGELLLEREEFTEAARCLEQALALSNPPRVDTHLSLGWALQESGRGVLALRQYQAAETLAPHSPAVHNYLGGYYEEAGKLDLAEAEYRKAITLNPRFTLPYARLGTLLRGKLPQDDVHALETWIEQGAESSEALGRLLFALAHVYDARGEFSRAAPLLRQANAITLELKRSRRTFDPDDHASFTARMIATFDRDFLDRTRGMGLDTRKPIFIFGLPRSGTTLIEQILASHPQVHGAGELRQSRDTFEGLPELIGLNADPFEAVTRLDRDAIERAARAHLDAMQMISPQPAARITDKMPDNYMFIGLLATLFPRASFIHCRRDLRDVAVSCWITDFRGMYWASDVDHIASRFQQYRRFMEHWLQVCPGAILEVDYEDSVANLEPVARRLVDFCGLEWSPRCLDFHRTQRHVRTASLTQVRQPVYTKSVGRYKQYESELGELFARLPAVAPPGAGS